MVFTVSIRYRKHRDTDPRKPKKLYQNGGHSNVSEFFIIFKIKDINHQRSFSSLCLQLMIKVPNIPTLLFLAFLLHSLVLLRPCLPHKFFAHKRCSNTSIKLARLHILICFTQTAEDSLYPGINTDTILTESQKLCATTWLYRSSQSSLKLAIFNPPLS